MARILVTGIVAQDIVNTVDHYPAEDEEIRAESQAIRCGGNAANTAMVLTQHSHDVNFLGTIADDFTGDSLIKVLQNSNIDTHDCPRVSGTAPTSYITLNKKNGSRTIVHYRDLAELSATDFPIDVVSNFDWFHFEGRNISETRKILEFIRSQREDRCISLEVEKFHESIESLFELVDVLLFSHNYACYQGFENPETFLKSIPAYKQKSLMVCSWGEAGAVGMDKDDQIFKQPVYRPAKIIDTVGAGDTFNAGFIHSIINGKTAPEATRYACELAGRKVGQSGLKNLIPL